MNSKAFAIHCTWALLAAAAWWLGAQRSPDTPASRSPAAKPGTPAKAARDSAHPIAPRVTAGMGESIAWLDSWRGADGRISPDQMSAAVLAALRDPDSLRGMRNFMHLLENLTPGNAAAAVLTLKQNDGTGTGDTAVWLELLCAAWGAMDGASAIATLTDPPALAAAMTAWAAKDPAAAKLWLGQAPGLPNSYVIGLAHRDVAEAVRYIAAQPEDERAGLTAVIAKEMLRRGIAEAGAWAASLDDSTMRGPALEMVACKYMAAAPDEGAAWAAENAAAPDMRDAVGRVADRIADKDVLAAYTWTQQLPPGPGQEEAYQQVFSEWARQDPTASSQELLSMPPSPNRDQAIHSFSRSLVKENPESAIAWAGAISDPAQRLETQIDVARQWHAAAPEAAATWITAHLPADARAKALAGE